MKKYSEAWISVLCALCIIALCTSCSSSKDSSETELAIKQFYDRLAAEDYVTALGLYNAEVRGMLEVPGGEIDDGYVEWAKEETRQGSVDHVAIVEESVEADQAEIKYEVFYGDGSSVRRTVMLTREDGQWKLGFIDNS